MKELIKRENEVFRILHKLKQAELEFIIVGGYAVSAFKHRFSVDVDLVISSENLENFKEILKKDFIKSKGKELKNVHCSKFMRYEKEEPKISIDLLIGGVSSRITNGFFSYELIKNNSQIKKIVGIEKEIEARVPIKELLIATKIHSGRLTDFRDIAALAKDTNLKTIQKFISQGNLNKVRKNLKQLNKAVKDKNFANSFKGVFLEKKFDIDLAKTKKISELTIKKI